MRVGIQGGKGSTNERACMYFAQKYGWKDLNVQYLITTKNVLKALHENSVDFGTFAWKSSRLGLVEETQEAIKEYAFKKVGEHDFQLDHALLLKDSIDTTKRVNVYSHPQALLEHKDSLTGIFPNWSLRKELDTALAAQYLSEGKYPKNTVVIAPLSCANLYGLRVFLRDLPKNAGYITTIYLAQRS